MKKCNPTVVAAYIAAITLVFLFVLAGRAQNVARKGNTFIERADSVTKYYYQKGDSIWNIRLSSNGKAYIIRYSKRTGKPYRQYLPSITKAIKQ